MLPSPYDTTSSSKSGRSEEEEEEAGVVRTPTNSGDSNPPLMMEEMPHPPPHAVRIPVLSFVTVVIKLIRLDSDLEPSAYDIWLGKE